VAVAPLKYRARQTAGNARLYVRQWTSPDEGMTDSPHAFAERGQLLLIEAEVLPPISAR